MHMIMKCNNCHAKFDRDELHTGKKCPFCSSTNIIELGERSELNATKESIMAIYN